MSSEHCTKQSGYASKLHFVRSTDIVRNIIISYTKSANIEYGIRGARLLYID